ncbi:MAG: MurR/RpiR family transcriptional regulator [Anaerolineales bacterium]|nr:MurR/RpiR family transcriptional regulator [Anaerolineales bacterium]
MDQIAALLSPNTVGLPIPFVRIRAIYNSLPPSERKVANYVLTHSNKVIHSSVTDLAEILEVSESTIVRFCQRLDYQGYQEFKILLARDVGTPVRDTYEVIDGQDDVTTVVRKVFQISGQALNDTLAVLNAEKIKEAASLLALANHIYIFGCGGSGGIAQVAGQKMLRVGLPCTVCTDPHTQTLLAGMATAQDLVLGISFSGNNEDVLRAMRVAHGRQVKTVGITNYLASPLAKTVDVLLLTGAAETPLGSEAGPSRVVQLSVIDALCTFYLLYKGR